MVRVSKVTKRDGRTVDFDETESTFLFRNSEGGIVDTLRSDEPRRTEIQIASGARLVDANAMREWKYYKDNNFNISGSAYNFD